MRVSPTVNALSRQAVSWIIGRAKTTGVTKTELEKLEAWFPINENEVCG